MPRALEVEPLHPISQSPLRAPLPPSLGSSSPPPGLGPKASSAIFWMDWDQPRLWGDRRWQLHQWVSLCEGRASRVMAERVRSAGPCAARRPSLTQASLPAQIEHSTQDPPSSEGKATTAALPHTPPRSTTLGRPALLSAGRKRVNRSSPHWFSPVL